MGRAVVEVVEEDSAEPARLAAVRDLAEVGKGVSKVGKVSKVSK